MFFGEPGPWFNQLDMDGDKTSVFHDVDGSVSEYPGSYLTKADNWLVRHPDCVDVPDWRGAVCSGRYAQVGARAPAGRPGSERLPPACEALPGRKDTGSCAPSRAPSSLSSSPSGALGSRGGDAVSRTPAGRVPSSPTCGFGAGSGLHGVTWGKPLQLLEPRFPRR